MGENQQIVEVTVEQKEGCVDGCAKGCLLLFLLGLLVLLVLAIGSTR